MTAQLIRAGQSTAMAMALVTFLSGCGTGGAPGTTLSAEDTTRIEEEVRQALEDYGASVLSGDQERVAAFWGDFDDFIHAGDGRVFGDREACLEWIASNRPDATLSWEYSDIHVAVLAPNAASYTANFEVVNVVGGEEVTVTGSWTYVLRKTEDGWRVVQSNGKHNGFSYYDESN